MDIANLSSNWKRLQSTITSEKTSAEAQHGIKRKQPHANHPLPRKKAKPAAPNGSGPISARRTTAKMETAVDKKLGVETSINAGLNESVGIGKYIALDCEMVGVGPDGFDSSLARVSIVNYNNVQVYDSFVLQKEEVTDWRTPISGIKPVHMKQARTFEEVQAAVAEILKDRVVVGHALRHDFKALLLDHPLRDIRDTSKHRPYKRIAGGTPKLSLLASQLLGLEIQGGEHSSLEDARACMLLFRRDKDAFEVKRPKGVKR